MNLKYDPNKEQVRGQIVTESGEKVVSYSHVCFGRTYHTDMVQGYYNSNSKYFDVFFMDTVSLKADTTEYTDRFLKELSDIGLFRNCDVQVVENTTLPHFISGTSKSWGNRAVRIRMDIDVITAQEMFLVGTIVRLVQLLPRVVVDYVKLLDLEPEVDRFALLCMAHCIFTDGRSNVYGEPAGHALISPYSVTLKVKSLAELHAIHDSNNTYVPMRKSNTYNWDGYLEQTIIDVNRPYVRSPYDGQERQLHRHDGVKYQNGVCETFFDMELCKKLWSETSPLFCARPPPPTKEEKAEQQRKYALEMEQYT